MYGYGIYMCDECLEEFDNENQLRMHSQIHLAANYSCFKCPNRYRKYVDMLAHVEYGCRNINAGDLNKSAAMCYQWKHFLDSEYRYDMLDMSAGYGRNWNHEGKPWKCLDCGKWCKKLSSLFERVWSRHGSGKEDEGKMGKLKRWLWNRHG